MKFNIDLITKCFSNFSMSVIVIFLFFQLFDSYSNEVHAQQQEQIRCLAMNIYHEARGESMTGQYAVAWVTLNRVNSNRYPNTICEVVRQAVVDRNGNIVRNRCQFSWYCDGVSDVIRDENSWTHALHVAQSILDEEFGDITDGAIMYHADYVSPYWASHYEQTVTIGAHIFYR